MPTVPGKKEQSLVLPLALLFALAFAALSSTLSGDFLVDDIPDLLQNPLLRSPGAWLRAFWDPAVLTPNPALMNYRPLTALSQVLCLSWAGPNPFWFHLVSVALHAANACLVFLLCLRLAPSKGGFPWAPAAAALLFALHPAQAESVGYITGSRGTLLAFFFSTASFLLYASREPGGWRRPGSVALFACALLSKESAAAAILLLPAFDWVSEGRNGTWAGRLRRWAPYAAALVVYLVVRRAALGRWAMRSPWGGDWLSHAASMGHGLFEDVRIALWPAQLRVCYSFPSGDAFWWGAAWKGALLLAAAAAVAAALRRRSLAGFALTWFAVMLLPVSNLLPIEALSADRFLYAPLAGLALLASRLLDPWDGKRALTAAALVLWLGTKSLEQQFAWQDGFSLDLAAHAAAPEDPCTSLDLSAHYYNWGMYQRAEDIAARALVPDSPPHLREAAAGVTGLCRRGRSGSRRGRRPGA